MSWLYSLALVEAFSAATCSDGARSALSNGTPTPRAFCAPDRMTAFSRPSRFGMTFGPLTDALGAELLTWFLAGFPVRTSAEPVTKLASTESGPDSGEKWREWLAKFDRDSCSWKTPQLSLLEASGESLETWPRSGMTRDGIAYPLPSAALLTSATGLGLLPTPTVQQGRNRTSGRSNPNSEHHDGLTLMDWLWLNVGQVKQKPSFVEWMMDWPLGWTDLRPLETDKSLNAPHSPGESSEAA
jgi:hypothetical protein